MKNENLGYDTVLKLLRMSAPAPDDAGELTESVMRRIDGLAPLCMKKGIMRVAALLSSAAAALLIGMLTYETVAYVPEVSFHSGSAEQCRTPEMRKTIDSAPRDPAKALREYVETREMQRARKKKIYASARVAGYGSTKRFE